MNEKKYLKWYHKVAYGSGDLASNCGYALISSFVMLYLTNAVGLNSAVIGTLMMVSKLLDGVSDIFFGGLMDRTRSRLGQARPWMLYGQIGVSACLFLVFSIPRERITIYPGIRPPLNIMVKRMNNISGVASLKFLRLTRYPAINVHKVPITACHAT